MESIESDLVSGSGLAAAGSVADGLKVAGWGGGVGVGAVPGPPRGLMAPPPHSIIRFRTTALRRSVSTLQKFEIHTQLTIFHNNWFFVKSSKTVTLSLKAVIFWLKVTVGARICVVDNNTILRRWMKNPVSVSTTGFFSFSIICNRKHQNESHDTYW